MGRSPQCELWFVWLDRILGEGLRDIRRGFMSLPGITAEALHYGPVPAWAQMGDQGLRSRWDLRHDFHRRRKYIGGFEWAGPGDHLVNHESERIDVGCA